MYSPTGNTCAMLPHWRFFLSSVALFTGALSLHFSARAGWKRFVRGGVADKL
jgi:hypothetical protein